MSFLSILDTLLLGPLKLIFEIIFSVANRLIGHPGLAIIVLSLIMNILVLPLYRRADVMQEEARDTEAKLRDGVAHIKKTFSGDERMFILQTYYRQNNYKPTSALNGSVSLLLEVPFFMAAYQFLSHVESLNGVALGPIADLGAPDGLLVIGGLTINLLPILMTLVNVISSAIYLKGFPLKTKIQLYGMAAFFLVFLYTSPACLVFYWTLNNVFSLVKTIFYKLKEPGKVLGLLASAAGLLALVFGLFFYGGSAKRKLFVVGVGLLLQLPMVLRLLKGKLPRIAMEPNKKLFVLGGIFLTVLVGVLIPSAYIAASPQEFVDVNYFHNPLWYLLSSGCMAAGMFLVWLGVFYWLASPKAKAVFDRLVWVLCGVFLVSYMFFGRELGVVSSALQYERGLQFSTAEQTVNLLVLLAVAAVLFLFAQKWHKVAAMVLLTAVFALGGMSALNMVKIQTEVNRIALQDPDEVELSDSMPHFALSKTGKNVIVLMLDRAMGEYIPYLMQENPELAEQFDGFTYYANTVSFGSNTNFGAPALLGGYEYTPVELNKREEESLLSKHNEALKVMPVLFSENGYDVTVCDPVYAGYQWIPDLSIYDEYPEIQAYNTKGRFTDTKTAEKVIENNYRNFFCFSLMKTVPVCLQSVLYNDGLYNQAAQYGEARGYSVQFVQNVSQAVGIDSKFMDSYQVLENMTAMTRLTEEGNTFLFLENELTHEPMLLQTPEYTPAETVDNTAYDAAHTDRFVMDGVQLKVDTYLQMNHYQTNMAALQMLGDWFDSLRELGVYDNTRIILVSDHANDFAQLETLLMDDGMGGTVDVSGYFPLLMVKDFDSQGFTTSREFMTNADVPTLAVQGLIENPVNPFTGKVISSEEKTAHDQYIIISRDWDVLVNNGNTFLPASWAAVKENLWDEENWTFYLEKAVLKEHKLP